MPKLTVEQMREFLARPDVDCHLACLDEDGSPYIVPCTYLYEDDGVCNSNGVFGGFH
jgi:nitroimidazol reductase NimA-like FMN-containing flavoprotein (pyridoxamine 5'-phosphate oxidase superfamily)